ncbi:MAG: hypothetical protein ACPGYY_10520 [Bacteroidia bacterium]
MTPGITRFSSHKNETEYNIATSDIKGPKSMPHTASLTPISDIAGTGNKVCMRYAIGTNKPTVIERLQSENNDKIIKN